MDRGDPFVVQNARSTIKGSSFDGQLCVASIADRRTVGIDGTGKVSVLDRHRPIIVNGTITALFGDGGINAAVAGDDHRSPVDQRSSGKVHIVHTDAVSVQIQDHALFLWQLSRPYRPKDPASAEWSSSHVPLLRQTLPADRQIPHRRRTGCAPVPRRQARPHTQMQTAAWTKTAQIFFSSNMTSFFTVIFYTLFLTEAIGSCFSFTLL